MRIRHCWDRFERTGRAVAASINNLTETDGVRARVGRVRLG